MSYLPPNQPYTTSYYPPGTSTSIGRATSPPAYTMPSSPPPYAMPSSPPGYTYASPPTMGATYTTVPPATYVSTSPTYISPSLSPRDPATMSSKSPEPDVKATDKSKASMEKIMDWIKSELDGEGQMLWTTFIEYDERLEACLDKEQLKKMLQYFDATANDENIAEYMKSILGENASNVTFVKLLTWWDQEKASESGRGGGMGLRSMLMARFATQKLKSWSGLGLIMKSDVEKRIDNLTESAIQRSLKAFSSIIVGMRMRRVFAEDSKLDAAEAALNTKFMEHMTQQMEKSGPEGMEVDDYDRFVLMSLFDQFSGADGRLLQKNLPVLCLCLDVNLPSTILRMTDRVYPDPMSQGDFMKWCSARGLDAASKGIANMFKIF